MKPKQLRQGDLLIESVHEIPNSAVTVKTDGLVELAYGEATGHVHAVQSPGIRHWVDPTDQFIEILEPAEVTHPEHGPIPLQPGRYRVRQQREYVAPQTIRRVQD